MRWDEGGGGIRDWMHVDWDLLLVFGVLVEEMRSSFRRNGGDRRNSRSLR